MLQKHPEVNQGDQVIGWQPVYSTQQQSQVRSQSSPNFILGIAAAVTLICIATSGSLLWSKASKTDAEVTAEIQQALVSERERITQCVTTIPEAPKRPNRMHQTMGNR